MSKKNYDILIDNIKKIINTNPENEESWFILADAYSEQKKYDDAITAVQKVININPNNDKAWGILANIYDKQKKYDDATAAIQKAINISPNNENHHFISVSIFSHQKKYDSTVKGLQKIIDINPKNEKAWSMLSGIYSVQEKYEEAITAIKKVLDINPKDEKTWRILATLYSHQNKYTEAIIAIKKALDINSKNEDSWVFLMAIYNKQKKFEKAIGAIQKALDINSKDEKLWNFLANIYENQEEYEKAIKALKHATDINPKNEKLWRFLARVYDKQENYKEVFESLYKAINISPKNEELWGLLGSAYIKQENYDAATLAIEKAIDINPKNEKVLILSAVIQYELENYEESLDIVQDIIKLNPANESAYVMMVSIYKQIENIPKMNSYLNKLLTIPFHKYQTDLFLGSFYDELGENEKAEAYYKKAQKTDSTKPDAYYLLGTLFKKMQQYNKALKEFKFIEKNCKTNAHIYYEIGVTYSKLLKYEQAQKYLQKATIKNPHPLYIEELSKVFEYQRKYIDALKTLLINLGRDHISFNKIKKLSKKMKSPSDLIDVINQTSEYNTKINEITKVINRHTQYIDQKKYYNSLLKIMIFVNNFKHSLLEKGVNQDSTLYQYTSINTLKSLLKLDGTSKDTNLNIRLYNTDYMNDPEEGKAFIKEVQKHINTSPKKTNNFNHSLLSPKYSTSHAFIASLTKNKDEIPMWSMYGDSNKGISIGFGNLPFKYQKQSRKTKNKRALEIDFNSSLELITKSNEYSYIEEDAQLYKVFYIDFSNKDWIGKLKNENSNLYKLILEIEKLQNILNSVERKQIYSITNYFVSLELDRIKFLIKNSTYSYENEYRLLQMIKSFQHPDTRVKYDKNNPKLYTEVPNVSLQEVIFGVNSDDCSKWRPIIEMKSPKTNINKVRNSTIKIRFN